MAAINKTQTATPKRLATPVAQAVDTAAQGKQAQSKPDSSKKKLRARNVRGKKKKGFTFSVAALGLVNIALIVSTVGVLGDSKKKAQELKELRGIGVEGITSQDVASIEKEIAATKESVSKLSSFFADDGGLVNFVKEVDNLKSNGVVVEFSFASNDVVRDKTGSAGLPIAITFQGSWADIDRDLRKIQSLPYLQRAIEVEINRLPDDLINFRYGGFLYVEEKENK